MSRPKTDPVVRAFEAVIALDADESKQFSAMLTGYNSARIVVKTIGAASRPGRKPKPAEVKTDG